MQYLLHGLLIRFLAYISLTGRIALMNVIIQAWAFFSRIPWQFTIAAPDMI